MTELPLQELAIIYGTFAVAYLIGSLSFAVIIAKLMRQPDPRTYGSGNPGATNVLRSGNKLAAALTLLLDAFKGWLPVFLVQHYSFELRIEDSTIAFVGLAAFIGHLFPVFFRFQGGKGVATALGVLLAFSPWLGLGTLFIWALIAGIFRYSSLAAIVAALFAPFFALLFLDRPIVSLSITIMSLMLIWRHWGNIMKLLTGKESRIGDKPVENKRRRRRTRRLHDDLGAASGRAGGAGSVAPASSPSSSQSKGNP